MLSIKLVRSLVLGETISNPLHYGDDRHKDKLEHDNDDDDVRDSAHGSLPKSSSNRSRSSRGKSNSSRNKTVKTTPLLLFLPTKEVVKDTYRLATIARDMGMDLYPNPSLSHIIFTWLSSSSSSSLPSSALWSSSSSSWPTSLFANAVPLPFPSLTVASTTHLNSFVSLSKGLFKLVHDKSVNINGECENKINNWDCSSHFLVSRVTGDRIDSMEIFSRVLAGTGWSLFMTKKNTSVVSYSSGFSAPNAVYLFRKADSSRVQALKLNSGSSEPGAYRIRELRLPPLDFRNAPLRILQYILLMTDDVFCLA